MPIQRAAGGQIPEGPYSAPRRAPDLFGDVTPGGVRAADTVTR